MIDGTVHPDFVSVAETLRSQILRSGGGAAACAYYQGECVVDVWGGVRDDAGNPWQRDTMSVSFSTTKGIVTTALHMLVDRGALDYDEPVARYWPEFAQAGKGGVTVRDVMSHRAGLYDIRGMLDDARQMLDWEAMTKALAKAEPILLGADESAYHALTYGHIVGELVQRISGAPLRDFIRTEIAEPLGLDGFYIGAPAEELGRAARLVGREPPREERGAGHPRKKNRRVEVIARGVEYALRAGGLPADFKRAATALAPRGISHFDFSSDEVLMASLPSANGLFTARSLAAMYAALANGGELDGVRLLSRQTLERATQIQVQGNDQIIIFPMRWRLGYHRVGTFRGRMRLAFGHFGYGGSGAWADPRRNLSFAMVLNAGKGTPLGDLRMLRLNTALLRCAKRHWQRDHKTATSRLA